MSTSAELSKAPHENPRPYYTQHTLPLSICEVRIKVTPQPLHSGCHRPFVQAVDLHQVKPRTASVL